MYQQQQPDGHIWWCKCGAWANSSNHYCRFCFNKAPGLAAPQNSEQTAQAKGGMAGTGAKGDKPNAGRYSHYPSQCSFAEILMKTMPSKLRPERENATEQHNNASTPQAEASTE